MLPATASASACLASRAAITSRPCAVALRGTLSLLSQAFLSDSGRASQQVTLACSPAPPTDTQARARSAAPDDVRYAAQRTAWADSRSRPLSDHPHDKDQDDRAYNPAIK